MCGPYNSRADFIFSLEVETVRGGAVSFIPRLFQRQSILEPEYFPSLWVRRLSSAGSKETGHMMTSGGAGEPEVKLNDPFQRLELS